MTSRERLNLIVNRRPADRIGLYEMVFWPETLARWQVEGLPAGAEPNAFLGMDDVVRLKVDNTLRLETQRIEEDAEFVVERDNLGVTKRVPKAGYAPPHELDYLIKTPADWDAYRERLCPAVERYTPADRAAYQKGTERGAFRFIQVWEPMWFVMHLIGYVNTLMAIADDPDFIRRIMADYTGFLKRQIELTEDEGVVLDALWLNADLCSRQGMVFSPEFYREVVAPFDRVFAGMCAERKIPLMLHCCGHVSQLVPLLVEVGYACLHPLEARAGNDVRELKRVYGDRLAFIGNISVETLGGSKEAIAAEMRTKLPAAMAGGGYIFASDHSVPPSVSLDNYRFAVELAKELGRYA